MEAYNIVGRRMKSNNKTPFHRKILIFFADNIGLIKAELHSNYIFLYFAIIGLE